MKRTIKTIVSLTLMFALLTACGSNSSNSETTIKIKQQTTKHSNESKDDTTQYTIGIAQIAPHASLDNCREGFIAGLSKEGFVEEKNLTIDYKNAEGETTNASMITDTFTAKQYDLICGIATPTAMAAYNSALETEIPVIFTAVSDPVASGIVNSLEKPETNCTGTCDALPLEEQMKLIRTMMPEAKTIGILYTTSEVNSITHLEAFEALAPTYGFTIEAIGVNTASDIPLAVDTLLTKCDVINNFTDNNVVNNLDTVLAKANEAGIPVFGSEEEQVKKGCVASQSIDYYALGVETGIMAANILKGEDASTMAVKVISDATLVANQEAMNLFGLAMPEEYKDIVTYLTVE